MSNMAVVSLLLGCMIASAPPFAVGAPTTYNCAPGTPDSRTGQCKCPQGSTPGINPINGIPRCGRDKDEDKKDRNKPPVRTADLTCGDFAPRVRVSCTMSCGDDRWDSTPTPWEGPLSWRPLGRDGAGANHSCNHGPHASAVVNATCTGQENRLALDIEARATRGGGCLDCMGSSGYASFEWRTVVPKQRTPSALLVRGIQPQGTSADARCKLHLGADVSSWPDVKAGLVKPLGEISMAVRLSCTDVNSAFVGVGLQGGLDCRSLDDPGSLRLEIETRALTTPTPITAARAQAWRRCEGKPIRQLRGSAVLDPASGKLSVTMELDTASAETGPKGKVAIQLLDRRGMSFAVIESAEIGMGGKTSRKSTRRTLRSSIQLSDYLVKRVDAMSIDAECVGDANAPVGIGADRTKAFGLTVQ